MAPPNRQRVIGAIAAAAGQTGVDFSYLLAKARIESQLDPTAHAGRSSATGLYQFTRQTWLATVSRHGPDHGLDWAASAISRDSTGHYRIDDPALRDAVLDLREQPEASAAMAAELAADNANRLQQSLGRPPEGVDLYLAHFLGVEGASRFLSAMAADPDTAAGPLFPDAAAANPAIFRTADGDWRSLSAIRADFADRLAAGGALPAMPFDTVTWTPGLVALSTFSPTKTGLPPSDRAPIMRAFEPMPRHLSLDFARAAYERLAGLGEGTV
jgi:hypothetical protein